MRRDRSPLYGRRYCGNTNKQEVHDLDRENVSGSGFHIDEIIEAGNAATFNPDTLEQTHKEGFDNCAKCLGSSNW